MQHEGSHVTPQHSPRGCACSWPAAHADPSRASEAGAALPRLLGVFIPILSGHSVAPEGANWSIKLRSRLAQPSYSASTQEHGTHPAISILLPPTQHH